MILSKEGESAIINGKKYEIGNTAIANGTTVYKGAIGEITEIRTDKDKDTDNVGPDIYFQILGYGEVVMAADMIQIIGG